MIKYSFCYTLVLFIPIALFSQNIRYTNNKLVNVENHQYKIIGEVKDNVIVWENDLNKHNSAKIFVYDNSMKLINTINTNILKSEADPNPEFYNAKNLFFAAYQYKNKGVFMYKFSAFDELGNLISTQILDSLNIKDQSIVNQTFFYKILQSENGKIICFSKMHFDSVYHVIKFNCRFISSKEITEKNFVISFDDSNEELADILVDNNKNILLLKKFNSESSVKLQLVKKNYSNEQMLIADKPINIYGFVSNTIKISEKPNGYLIFGEVNNLKQRNESKAKTGLYVWQTDNGLNDVTADTILSKQYRDHTSSYTANITASQKFSNVFATWNYSSFNNKDGANFTATKLPSGSALENYPINNTVVRTITGMNLTPGYNRIESSYPSTENIPEHHPNSNTFINISKLELFKINSNNSIAWVQIFTDSIDELTTGELSSARIIAGENAIHVIYEAVTSKKTKALYDFSIRADGTFTKNFFSAWDMRYEPVLNDCLLTKNNYLLVPATNGGKLKIGKLKLE